MNLVFIICKGITTLDTFYRQKHKEREREREKEKGQNILSVRDWETEEIYSHLTTYVCIYHRIPTFVQTLRKKPIENIVEKGDNAGNQPFSTFPTPLLKLSFLPAYFRPSSLQKHVRKVVVALERKVVLALM